MYIRQRMYIVSEQIQGGGSPLLFLNPFTVMNHFMCVGQPVVPKSGLETLRVY